VPNIPKDEEILAYIVATMWGGVGDGLAFTTRRIAWRNGQWNIPGGASKFGQLPYSEFPATKFKKMTGMEIDLGPGLGFNHAGWCTLTTAQILELLESIKALLIHKHA
jgi:hypothetical protein